MALRHRADDGPLLHAVLEEDEEGDAHGAVLHGRALVLVDVELADADVAALRGELVEHRRDHAARAAPRRPEVDEPFSPADLLGEAGVAQRDRMAVAVAVAAGRDRKLTPALSTGCFCVDAELFRHAVGLAA